MAEHYCEVHKTPFLEKTGKFGKFWSHKLEDGSYCNEPKEKQEEAKQADPPIKETKPAFIPRGSPEERNSIETQVAIKEIGEDWRADKRKDNDQGVLARNNWLMSKLSYWSSIGDLPTLGEVAVKIIKVTDPRPTASQAKSSTVKWESSAVVSAEEVIADLKLILDSKKITSPEVVHILREEGGKGTGIRMVVKSLSPEGLAKFAARVKPLVPSKLVQEAKKLGAEEIDPENLPF